MKDAEPQADFRDHFAAAAAQYAAYRPRYPPALFATLARLAPARRRAWDCATGSGQAAIGLAEYFDEVIATDASVAQLAAAQHHPRVRYQRAPAEASGLPARSVDLVTVAQALHWLDPLAFYEEVRRVLGPGGVLAVWCYGLVTIDTGVDALISQFYHETVGPYWPPERAQVESGYRTIDFPFAELAVPPVVMEAEVTLEELAGYLGTWSAVLRYREARGHDPIPALVDRLRAVWGAPPAGRRAARWDLALRAGRVVASPPLR